MIPDLPELNIYFVIAVVVVTTVLSAGRLTRLLTADTLPPVVAFRIWWEDHTSGGYEKLVSCPWCSGPWITAVVGAWGLLSHFHWTWWLFNGWMALSYATSWVVYHDED